MQRRVYYFSGRVQGVGFRYTARHIAMQHDVGGYVRNMPDGRVELVMEGPEIEMDAVAEAVNQKMKDYIKKADFNVYPATGEFEQFNIRH